MKRRIFLKGSAAAASLNFIPPSIIENAIDKKLRTAHIGVGGMGNADLTAISSHQSVEVVALCDVDSKNLAKAIAKFPNAKGFSDYRQMLIEMDHVIDAVIISTPDHTHAPASMMVMEMDKALYCQKPLAHEVAEARAMAQLAKDKNLVTQMGIQVHSFYDYRLATHLIQSGIIGKVSAVRAWSNKWHGTEEPEVEGGDPVPDSLDWNLWLGTAKERPYQKRRYHPGRWRRYLDYGCGTLGDMGVHIFDTPYNALQLDVPYTIENNCRQPNGYGHPEINQVEYEFPGTKYTTDSLKWIWYDGPGAPNMHTDFKLPQGNRLPDQGALFIGEKGRLLLPHFMELPRLIIDGKYKNMDDEIAEIQVNKKLGEPIRDYNIEGAKHYHQFVDACLGNATCSAPFSYSSRLTEVILLGVIAGRFPNQKLHWDTATATFREPEANQYLRSEYRDF